MRDHLLTHLHSALLQTASKRLPNRCLQTGKFYSAIWWTNYTILLDLKDVSRLFSF